MTDPKMTPRHAYSLLVLSRHPEGLSMGQLGGGFAKADREFLASRGLVTTAKVGSRRVVTLSDRGWLWLSEGLPALFDVEAASLGERGLAIYVTSVAAYLSRRGVPFSEVASDRFEADDPVVATCEVEPPPPLADIGELPVDDMIAVPVPERVRRAYFDETDGRRDEYVTIAALRLRMPDLARDVVDEALCQMQRVTGDFAMNDMENRADASREVREGACVFDGIAMHFVRITS